MSQANDLIQHLRTNGLRLRAETDSDGQLLGRFLDLRDESAFESLMARLGPMVWSVCRRLLPDAQDAEDAFQATFLVLVRKGQTVNPRDRVGNWLYGVAYTAAQKARVNRARRREKEHRAATMAETIVPEHRSTADLAASVDRELARLPAKYRAPVVLCDMQGKTRQEAARHLGWPEGTVAGRLVRARAMLAKRLAKYAVGVSPVAVTAVLSDAVGAQGPPTAVAVTTLQGALGLVSASPRAVVLTDAVLRSMFLHKIQMVAVGLGLVLAAGLGVGGLVRGQFHDPAPPPLGGAVAVVERPLPPPDPVAILREKLVGRWQVDAGTRNGQPLTAWETRGYQIDFDERDLRIQRGTIRDLRTFAWTIEPAAEPSTVILTPPDGNAATAVRMTVELKDEALTLSWDESATPPRGRIPSSTSRLTLSRSVPDGSAQAGLTVAPAAENVVGSRLAGEWEPDPELAKRLGPAAAKARLTITADPAVAREIPVTYRPMLADKRIYLAGRMRAIEATDATYPFLLVEHLGNPLLVYFLPIGPDVCAAEEAATVMLVRAADRKDDLLVVTAFDTAKHAPAGGYRRVLLKK